MQGGNRDKNDTRSGHSSGHGNSNVAYFIPGEIVVAVTPEHPEDSPKTILRNLVHSSPLQADTELRDTFAHLSRVTALSDKVALVITRLHGAQAAGGALLERITRLNERIAQQGGGNVVALTPNWLSSGCPGSIGPGGGPGGQPVAPASRPKSGDGQFQLPANFTNTVSGSNGQGAVVAVLDTLPDAVDLQRAYDTWQDNWLLQALRGNSTSFQTHPAGGMHLLQTVDFVLQPHSYPMPDHGLFVSGIIRTIAPEAEIHLIETLNPYGVGSLESIANAVRLAHALAGPSSDRPKLNGPVPPSAVVSLDESRPQSQAVEQQILPASGLVSPFVVNCSFMFNVPMHVKHHFLRRPGDGRLHDAGKALERIWRLLDPLLDPANANARLAIVAAAGNDGNAEDIKTGDFPPARYPAAFTNVTGAGALNRDDTPAMYTDLADQPDSVGFATLGGNVVSGGNYTGADGGEHYIADSVNGILGIYSSPVFPDGTQNTSGWARWAGTSFAAPIVSAACALGLALPSSSGGGTVSGALEIIKQASTGGAAGGISSPIGPVFEVKQN